MCNRRTYLFWVLLASFQVANAASLSFSGYFNDTANAALVASDLTAPLFTSDTDIANNVAIYDFTLASAGAVSFNSLGFAQGGVDPYFSLFAGSGNSATFVDSNYNQAFLGGGGDFSLAYSLAAGHYEIALGSFANMSYTENNPGLYTTLGDGFIGLGTDIGTSKPYYYQLQVSSDVLVASVPEPSLMWLYLAGFVGLLGRKRLTNPGNN